MTYNRGRLKREIQKGLWLVKCDGKYTDDYAFDAANNYGKTGYVPAIYFPSFHDWLDKKGLADEYNRQVQANPNRWGISGTEVGKLYNKEKDSLPAGIKFDDSDFRGYGMAWTNDNGATVALSFGYVSYTFKRKEIK